MSISKAVTKDEWQKVYEETLQLVKAFPLAESRQVDCKGIKLTCLVPTEEREDYVHWGSDETAIGWFADGDYETMHTAECYALYRDLITDDDVDENAGDAILSELSGYLDDYDDSTYDDNSYSIWGNKTQGEPYHIYLLAIACLIESRLQEKAFVYGDITRGQCKRAVELANKYLQTPIEIPARCDLMRFQERISRLPVSKSVQLEAFIELYLGTKDDTFGQHIRNFYQEDLYMNYWKKRFDYYTIDTLGFSGLISKYLSCGFCLEKLCALDVCFDKNGCPQYQKFIKRILDAKLHIKEKNCKDMLKIDQEEDQPYSIYTLIAQFAFLGAENKKVDRYVPIEEIKRILINTLGDKCNVEDIVNDYIKKENEEKKILSENATETDFKELCEQDASEALRLMMDKKKQVIYEEREKYEIISYEDLIYYEEGDTIEPALEKALHGSFSFYNSLLKEEDFQNLMNESARERCEWLAEENRYLLLRKTDWENIFAAIETKESAFERYYPMVRVALEAKDLEYMAIAFVLNDELYQHCKSNCQE